jgi:hypothetical protein
VARAAIQFSALTAIVSNCSAPISAPQVAHSLRSLQRVGTPNGKPLESQRCPRRIRQTKSTATL